MLAGTSPSQRRYRPSYSFVPEGTGRSRLRASFSPSKTNTMPGRRLSAAGRESSLYGMPTVATSAFNASASTRDIASQGGFKRSHSLHTLTKIPTPMSRNKPPVLREQLNSGNVLDNSEASRPTDTRDLLIQEEDEGSQEASKRPHGECPANHPRDNNHPGSQQYSLLRTRTLNTIANITHSLSRSNMSKSPSKASVSSYSAGSSRANSGPGAFSKAAARANASVSESPVRYSRPEDLFSVHSKMAHSYWAGRYSTLNDKYHEEVFDPGCDEDAVADAVLEVRGSRGQKINKDDFRVLKVFAELEGHCLTVDAKQSLWDFQQECARKTRNANVLPAGGTMCDSHKEGLFSKAGSFFRPASRSEDARRADMEERKRMEGKVAKARRLEAWKAEKRTQEARQREEAEKKSDAKRTKPAKKKSAVPKENRRPTIGNPVLITNENQHQQSEEVLSKLTDQGFCWDAEGARPGE